MTRKNGNRSLAQIKALLEEESDFLRPMVRAVIQEFLEAEMAEAVGAEKGERVGAMLYTPTSITTSQYTMPVNSHKAKTNPLPSRAVLFSQS
jgi:transposase-like protein